MNRSFSKIRHIQESNMLLETRIGRRGIHEQAVSASIESGMKDHMDVDIDSLTDCISFITSGAGSVAEPMDPEMMGQGIIIEDVVISYNPTVSPNYRSVTMSKNGIPFCSTKVR